jgi:hypothetical protein
MNSVGHLNDFRALEPFFRIVEEAGHIFELVLARKRRCEVGSGHGQSCPSGAYPLLERDGASGNRQVPIPFGPGRHDDRAVVEASGLRVPAIGATILT